MLSNYLKIAFRNLIRSKAFSLLNIAGLAIGLGASFVILHYVIYETGFDKYHTKKDRIYRVIADDKTFKGVCPGTPFILGPTIEGEFPEIESVARTLRLPGTKLKRGDLWEPIQDIHSVDGSLFEILNIDFIEGNPQTALSDPSSMVISEAMADKCFSGRSAMGRTLTIENRAGTRDLQVTGIFRNLPEQSTFRVSCMTSISLSEDYYSQIFANAPLKPSEAWVFPFYNTFVLLKENVDAGEVENKLLGLSKRVEDPRRAFIFRLQSLKDIYLHSNHMMNHPFPEGNVKNITIFSFVTLLILFMAGINFILLTTAKSAGRVQEIGVRKVIGAGRGDLIGQVLFESMLTAFIALPLAMCLAKTFLPVINEYLGKELSISYFSDMTYGPLLLLITLALGLFSGIYTSFVISKFQPVDMLRKKRSGVTRSLFKKGLIVLQLIVFITLISDTFIIDRQIAFSQYSELGFDTKEVIVVDNLNESFLNHYPAFKEEIKMDPRILNVSAASTVPPSGSRTVARMQKVNEPEKTVEVEGVYVDYDFFQTMGIEIIEGKGFSDREHSMEKSVCVVNERCVDALGIVNPLSTLLSDNMRIVGVVRDFHVHSLRSQIPPLIFQISDTRLTGVVIKLTSENFSETIEFIERKWRTFTPDQPFEYHSLDRRIEALYQADMNFGRIIKRFSNLAVVIACLGLIGLSLIIAQQRKREIGIRKVLGATSGNIVGMLSKELFILVIISTCIAVPVAWFGMERWLQDFAYRIDISITIFMKAGFWTLAISWLTVWIQIVKAALTNPVNVIRHE